jgi:hypothetical protein
MRLSAVAIMANNVGCVCLPTSGTPRGSDAVAESSTAVAGMSTIMMEEAAEQSRRQQYQTR